MEVEDIEDEEGEEEVDDEGDVEVIIDEELDRVPLDRVFAELPRLGAITM